MFNSVIFLNRDFVLKPGLPPFYLLGCLRPFLLLLVRSVKLANEFSLSAEDLSNDTLQVLSWHQVLVGIRNQPLNAEGVVENLFYFVSGLCNVCLEVRQVPFVVLVFERILAFVSFIDIVLDALQVDQIGVLGRHLAALSGSWD